MHEERFFKDPRLPFAECRHSTNSTRTFKPHMHRCFSIGAVDRGEIRYRLEEQTFRLLPESLALINPQTLHACNQDEVAPAATPCAPYAAFDRWRLDLLSPMCTVVGGSLPWA